MALRSFPNIPYIPYLCLRPAEMQALQELPSSDKAAIAPLFEIGSWVGAHYLHSSLTRLQEAYEGRPCFVTLAEERGAATRPVHAQLAELRSQDNSHDAWCSFIESNESFIPTLQLGGEFTNLRAQLRRLYSLDRGLMIVVDQTALSGLEPLARLVADATNGGVDVCIMLDFGRVDREVLARSLTISSHIRDVANWAPEAYASISASSFPEQFVGLDRQDIFERQLFDSVVGQGGARMIYSDRGSARAQSQSGGGGTPAPRVDYASRARWTFFRADEGGEDRTRAYQDQAIEAMRSADWDGNLRIWGTQMIERTASGDTAAITSPPRATAARINLHLHRQLFNNHDEGLYDTDDEWND